MLHIVIGAVVIVNQKHWLRAGQRGVIKEFDGTRTMNQWKVQFETHVIGGGFIDEEGKQCLWLDDSSLRLFENE